jgi:transposase
MGYKVGKDKLQLTFLPPCLDDYVAEDHICRVIFAFTQQLDMVSLGFKYAESSSVGNRPYDPRMMLNLYIYGYLNRVRSSRRLEAETLRNVEVMWLMDGLHPDDKTISNFRKDNTTALRDMFRAFNKMCLKFGLFGGEISATDGTKIRANSSRKKIHNQTTVKRELSLIDKRISEYLNKLDEADSIEAGEIMPRAVQIQEALEKLRERKEMYKDFLTQMEIEEKNEISTGDPDAHLMRQGGDGRHIDACYNVQTVVDGKHGLIVDYEVIERSDDKGNLLNMSERAMDIMETETLSNLADKGYYDGEDIAACEKRGVTCLVSKPKAGGAQKSEGFRREQFIYNREEDYYLCPCKSQLKFMRMQKDNNGKECRLYANYHACNNCACRCECTKGRYRKILRLSYQDTLDIVDERTKNNKELYRKRQEIVEHPFGTIKKVWGYRQFLCRTKPKVSAEMSLTYLAYNMRRAVNIFKEKGSNLVEAMGG